MVIYSVYSLLCSRLLSGQLMTDARLPGLEYLFGVMVELVRLASSVMFAVRRCIRIGDPPHRSRHRARPPRYSERRG